MTEPDAPSRRRSRPPRAPVPSLHPGERVRGSAILDENPECGLVLWESYRSVGDWATTPRARRVPAMFGAGAAERRAEQLRAATVVDEAARAALETLRGVVADPGRARARAVALACRRLSAWAGERGRPATQFYFAAAAGLCVPNDARHAYLAGRLARDLAKWDAAETWLEFAVAAAKRGRDRETQALAVLGLGNLYIRQGGYLRARDVHEAALTLARRHGLPEIEGKALHDLFVIAVELDEPVEAEALAAAALAAYGPSHANVPALAHDVAYFWLEQGHFARAASVFRAMLPHFRRTGALQLRVLANLGRAVAGCGDADGFRAIWSRAWTLVSSLESRATLAPALVDLAEGAGLLGDRERALHAAARALELARDLGETDVLVRAEAVAAAVDSAAAPPPRRAASPPDDTAPAADRLARELVCSLRQGSAAG